MTKSSTNDEAAKIIADLGLGYDEVAQYLNVTTDIVKTWFDNEGHEQVVMPEAELHFLKYCLMTDNKRSHLF